VRQPHDSRMPDDPAYQKEIIEAHDGALASNGAGYRPVPRVAAAGTVLM
jgi:hypothetical protein